MKQTPITTYDKRTIECSGMQHRQVGSRPGFPIMIEHRKIGSQWWDMAASEGMHSQQEWDRIVREGKVVA